MKIYWELKKWDVEFEFGWDKTEVQGIGCMFIIEKERQSLGIKLSKLKIVIDRNTV